MRDPDPLLGYTPGATNQYKPHVFGSGSDFGEDEAPAAGETRSRSSNLQTFEHLQQILQLHNSKSVIEFAKSVMFILLFFDDF